MQRAASIHTSDRIKFKRCRRAWNWTSPIRQHLSKKERVLPLWFGTGWHFILEDFHGENLYGDPVLAWRDYVRATLDYYGHEYMPQEFEESVPLGEGMVRNYQLWLQGRGEGYKTFVFNGIPQVEVNFKILIPINQEILRRADFDICYYEGTLDRVVEDIYGNLWIVEYKSAAQIFQMHYLTDPQVTSYCWAAQMLYGRPIAGCIYMQWRKDVPNEPRILQSGHISVADNQKTTHRQYRAALMNLYGEVLKAPKQNVDYLNRLAAEETPDADDFIRRDYLHRNQQSIQSEGVKILLETEEMLNPDLPLYPNPDRMCHFCDTRQACINLDDGSDWESELQDNFEPADPNRGRDPWRSLLIHPKQPRLMEAPLDRPYLLPPSVQYNPPVLP